MEKVNMTRTSLHTEEINSEWITDLNIRPKTINIFLKKEEKIFMILR